MPPQEVLIRCLEDLDHAQVSVGLPVGPRTGPRKRTKEIKEWYVMLGFLRAILPCGICELPFIIRNGLPPNEPDFVMLRDDSAIGWFEVTEATDESDQKEMTAFERSGKEVMMPGDFGGRFADGACRPGLVWAADVLDSIRHKTGKIIFRRSSAARHLLIYPNSNASLLLFDEEDEREAVDDLRREVAKDMATLARTANGCLIHVVGGHLLCFDTLGEATVRLLHVNGRATE